MAKWLGEQAYMLRYTYIIFLAASERNKRVHEIIKMYLDFRTCDLFSVHIVKRTTMQNVPTQ
jgi:hypothetical protein